MTGYTLSDEKDRISAVDDDGVEIVGARIRPGETVWAMYLTDRLTTELHRCHPVICSRSGARQWVSLIAELYVAAQKERQAA